MLTEDGKFPIEERYSAWQKKNVRTIIVNSRARNATLRSIAAAVTIAKPYDRIELTEGDYNESVTLNIPIEVVASQGESPRIVSRNSAITVTANVELYLENLNIVSKSTSRQEAAVAVVGGNPVIFRSNLSSVLIGGNGKAHIEHCTIAHSFSGYGLVVNDSGGGSIKNTRIHSHSASCASIDTRGQLQVLQCMLYNFAFLGGDVIHVSGSASSYARDGSLTFASCSRVTISDCEIYIDDTEADGAAKAAIPMVPPTHSRGVSCCAVVSSGAAPTFSSNEFSKGEVGILFDHSGSAQLNGNMIRCQSRCGILAVVEEEHSYARGSTTLCIKGDNVLDRCHIGIDVQCMSSRFTAPLSAVSSNDKAALRTLSHDLPFTKPMHAWLTTSLDTAEQLNFPRRVSDAVSSFMGDQDGADCTCVLNGVCTNVATIRKRLRALALVTLQVHPTCCSADFGTMTSSAATVVVADSFSTSPIRGLLNVTLGVPLVTDVAKDEAAELMLQMRGNNGLDIINTKFSNCGMCAIRFGRQGYGLVEDCMFEDCGTHAIVVDTAAHPLVTGCHFLRSRGAAILIGNFSNPLIIGNEIARGQVEGITVSHCGRGVIVGNMISSNQGCGIRVSKHSQPLVAANAIVQNRKGGVAVEKRGCPFIGFNRCTANHVASILCSESSDPFVVYNHVASGVDAGILMKSCCLGTFVRNEIVHNGDGAVVEMDADPFVGENTIMSNVRCGVVGRNNALGTFYKNSIAGSGAANVLLTEGARTVLRRNIIEKGHQGGVVITHEGGGLLEHNTIRDNSVANVTVVHQYTNPRFVSNSIYASASGCGIICAFEGGGQFHANKIYENKDCGVYIYSGGAPTFSGNTIAREAVGVLVSAGGRSHFTDNTVDSCYGIGVLIQSGGDPNFERNQIVNNRLSGLSVSPDGLGNFTENDFHGNNVGLHLGTTGHSGEPQLSSAYLHPDAQAEVPDQAAPPFLPGKVAGRPSGATAVDRGAKAPRLLNLAAAVVERHTSSARRVYCRVHSNRIFENLGGGGVLLEKSANAQVENNDIFNNGAAGVLGDTGYTWRHSVTMMTNATGLLASTVRWNHLEAAHLQSSAAPVAASDMHRAELCNNRIHGHTVANVLITNLSCDANVLLKNNDIYAAAIGIYIGNHSSLRDVEGNKVHNCTDGIYLDGGGGGGFRWNVVSQCPCVGVYAAGLANPSLESGNVIESCGVCGIMVDAGGCGTYEGVVVRRCSTGIICFAGPATPFSLPYDEVVRAHLVSATPTFAGNTVEENELHGVLVLSVINGLPLRSPLSSQDESGMPPEVDERDDVDHLRSRLPNYGNTGGGTGLHAIGKRLSPHFKGNIIRRNRVCGVYMERFEQWIDRPTVDKSTSLSALPAKFDGPGTPTAGKRVVKNAYGGYEMLLGTSIVLGTEEHVQHRSLRQVSFTENTISECSIGFSAGYGCHPFLHGDIIINNLFFGLLLRFGSAVMTHGCEISQNGIAGVYAASGAKGYLSSNKISSNNGFTRPDAKGKHCPRNFNAAIFAERFYTQSHDRNSCGEGEENEVAVAVDKAAATAALSYAHITRLLEVHTYITTDALCILSQLVAASSAGMALASAAAPSELFSSSPSREMNRRSSLGGVSVGDCVHVCTADGGIGVWIEEDSRTSVHGSTITQHTHMGVLLSKGLLHHHSILHGHFSMATEPTDFRRSDKHNILLEREAMLRPAMASAVFGVLFTTQPVCTTRAVVVALAASSPNASMDVSTTSMRPHLPSARQGRSASEERDERVDSINHATVSENVISDNQHGICIELSQLLRANDGSQSGKPLPILTPRTPASAVRNAVQDLPRFRSAFVPGFGSPFLTADPTDHDDENADGLEVLPEDMNMLEGRGEHLDYTVVVQGNRVRANRTYGILCIHNVEVACGESIPSRSVLSDRIVGEHAKLAADVLLGTMPYMAPRLPFSVRPVRRRTRHALIKQNELQENAERQGEVTSRYIALTGDGERTLIQLDTSAPAHSIYASRALLWTPTVATLLQYAPPGMFMWDDNTIRDSKHGIRVAGYIGSASLRLRGNHLTNVEGDAVLVTGHMACATIGDDNLFEQNGVSIRVDAQVPRMRIIQYSPDIIGGNNNSSSTSELLEPDELTDFRTRIFRNKFVNAGETAVLLQSSGESHVLLFQNEFTEFTPGATALLLSEGAARVLVASNTFKNSYTPVVAGRFGNTPSSMHGLPEESQRNHGSEPAVANVCFMGNIFRGNYIGALMCTGAATHFVRNLFEENKRAGLEMVGKGTRPSVKRCVFYRHARPSSETTTTALSPSAGDPHAPGTAAVFPDKGTLTLCGGAVSIDLVPSNTRVLAANDASPLPAGLLLAPGIEGTVTQCFFRENDIGVDAARGVNDGSAALPVTERRSIFATPAAASVVTVSSSLFELNRVAGVLVRGSGEFVAAMGASNNSSVAGPRASQGKAGTTAPAMSNAKETDLSPPPPPPPPQASATVFENCYFSKNTSNSNFGDVIAQDGGCALFCKGVFYGTVHGKDGGHAVVKECYFISSDEETAVDSPGAKPALVLHDGACSRFEHNVVYRRRRGVQTAPGSGGLVMTNRFVRCTIGLWVAPFNSTLFSKNFLWMSGDCALYAYGGHFTENEVFSAPTGVVVQHPSTYASINAVPMNARLAQQLLLIGNTISSCSEDGILVASPGRFEGNHVVLCRKGFNIIGPATSDLTSTPLLKTNVVCDNAIGVCMENGSQSTVSDCDIFDNDEIGLLIMLTATGTVQGNRISSLRERGAVEATPETRVRMLSNLIRNQFSPACNRGTRVNRAKDHDAKSARVAEEVDKIGRVIQGLIESSTNLADGSYSLLKELLANQRNSVAGIAASGTMAGLPSRAFRKVSVNASSLPELHSIDTISQKVTATKGRTPRRVGARQRRNAGTNSQPSASAIAVRKKARATSNNTGKSVGPTGAARAVLIHIFSSASTPPGEAKAIGQSVSRVLALPPMNKMNLAAHVTTTAAQLRSFLDQHHPSVGVVVVHPSMEEFGFSDRGVLEKLHQKLSMPPRSAQKPNLSLTIYPEGLTSASAGTGLGSLSSLPSIVQDGMSFAEYAAAHRPLVYTTSVDEALAPFEQALAEALDDNSGGRRPPMSPKVPRGNVAPRKVEDIERGDRSARTPSFSSPFAANDDFDLEEEEGSSDLLSRRKESVATPTPVSTTDTDEERKISRERIGQLLGLLSAEAFKDRPPSARGGVPSKASRRSTTNGDVDRGRRGSRNTSTPRKSSLTPVKQKSSVRRRKNSKTRGAAPTGAQ